MTVRARLTLWYSGLLVLIVAAFALGSYVYLDRLERDRIDRMLHEQSEIVVQSIASITADRSADDASRYLGLYGIACKTRAFASKADPAALVVAEAKALDAEMIVMGAYGHRLLKMRNAREAGNEVESGNTAAEEARWTLPA